MPAPLHSSELILHMLTAFVECTFADVGNRVINLKTASILGSSYLNPRVIEGLINIKYNSNPLSMSFP
jgi:hypothetical protein